MQKIISISTDKLDSFLKLLVFCQNMKMVK